MKKKRKNDDIMDIDARAIPGFVGYHITAAGRLYSVHRNRYLKGEICRTKKFGLCYQQYLLRQNGKNKNCRAHRLVYMAYKGPIPEKMVVHHSDGHGLNNSIENLQVMTQREHARKIMIRWYLCKIYDSVHEEKKRGMSISDITYKHNLTDEIIEILLRKNLDEVLKFFNV